MIHLVFECHVGANNHLPVQINDEFDAYAWVKPENVKGYDLNDATRKTFAKKGWV
jgi:nucleoside triphosphatase